MNIAKLVFDFEFEFLSEWIYKKREVFQDMIDKTFFFFKFPSRKKL